MNHKIYFVLAGFGHLGEAWVERSPEDMGREQTIQDLQSKQWSDVRRIVEVDVRSGTARDVCRETLEPVVYAATLADAQALCERRESEIKQQLKRDRAEEMAAVCRLLNL